MDLETTVSTGSNTILIISLIIIGFSFFYSFCQYLLARKLKISYPWFAFVPILNVYQILKISERRPWELILFFIPIIQFVMPFLVVFSMARRFEKDPLVFIFAWPVMFPYLAFTYDASKDVLWEGYEKKEANKENTSEGKGTFLPTPVQGMNEKKEEESYEELEKRMNSPQSEIPDISKEVEVEEVKEAEEIKPAEKEIITPPPPELKKETPNITPPIVKKEVIPPTENLQTTSSGIPSIIKPMQPIAPSNMNEKTPETTENENPNPNPQSNNPPT